MGWLVPSLLLFFLGLAFPLLRQDQPQIRPCLELFNLALPSGKWERRRNTDSNVNPTEGSKAIAAVATTSLPI